MSKALVTAAVLPSASRAFRSDARRISSSSGEARGVRFFFYCHRATTPFFLANTRIIIISSSSPNPFPHQVVERRRKDHNKTKENKIVLSLPKKGRAFLPFFRRVDADIFFRAENISILLFFFSANTLNVPKNPKQKIQKET